MIKKRILVSLLTLTMGSSLVLANAVYANGNPAESHDETSPLRRVQEMQYGDTHISYNKSFNLADAGGCSECQKQRDLVQLDDKHVKDVPQHKHHKNHHHKHKQMHHEHLKHEK